MDRKEIGFWRKLRKMILVPLAAFIILWIVVMILTENKSLAPFIYAIF